MIKSGLLGVSAALFMVCAAGSASAASIPAGSLGDVARSGTVSMVEEVQFRGGRRFGGPRVGHVRGGYYRGGRGWGRGVGAGVAAGVIGGLIGGAILNSQPAYAAPAPVYEEPVYVAPRGGGSVEYCMRRFRSYDPNTGTYIGLDGRERSCP